MKQINTRRKLPNILKGKISKKQNIKEVKENKKKNTLVKKPAKEDRLNKLEEAFYQGRQEYINLFKKCPEALVYTDIDGIILTINDCFISLTGFQRSELKDNSIVYSLKPEDSSYFETVDNDYFETAIQSRDGYLIEVSVSKSYNLVENRIAGIIYSFREISSLRRERSIAKTLYQISRIASSNITLQELFPVIHEQLGKIIDATNFYIALTDFDQKKIDFPYYTDVAAGDDEIFINRYCTSQSIFHYVLKVGKPVLMDFQRYRKMLSYGYIEPWDVMTNTHLWLAVPLKADEKVIGVIALQSYDNARLYSEKDIDLLEFVSQQLSAAIYKKALKTKITKIKHDLEQTGTNTEKPPSSPLPQGTSSNAKQDKEGNAKDN
ncbi:MAG: GAF domain-containing protein [Atribacterota bacterium]|nr:GAF domain-containing protein [Atribacterota bacterium]